MAVVDMLSLADWGNLIKGADAKALYSETVKGFYESDAIITHCMMKTAPIVKADVPFASSVPRPSTVGLGQPLTNLTIDVGGHEASIFLLGDRFSVDRLLGQQPSTLGDALQEKWNLYTAGAVTEMNRQFILGDPSVATQEKQFAGLQYRMANPDTFKLRSDLTNAVGSAGSPLDCSSAATAATARKLIRAIETGFAAVNAPDGEGCHVYGNQTFMGSFPDLCGLAGRFQMVTSGKDAQEGSYGYRRKSFGRAGLHDIGFDSTGTMILPNDASNGSELWIVNWKALATWQTNLMKIMSDPPLGPQDNYWFRWGFGMGEKNSFPIYRIRYVKWV